MPDVSAVTPSVAPPDHRSLRAYTTLRLGGPADRLTVATETGEAVDTVRSATRSDQPVLVLAGGSNVVVGDDGFPGTVVLLRTAGTEVLAVDADTVTVRVQAGEPWDALVTTAVDNGWSGLECLAGIPGSTGATPIQNVGAYGQEVAETITAVRVYDRADDRLVTMTGAQCGFGYRSSIFKGNDRWVVLSVDFRLVRSPLSAPVRYAELARTLGVETGQRVPLDAARAAVLGLRAGKGMVLDPGDHDTWSVGSFFTNPVLDAQAYQRLRGRVGELGDPPAWPGADGVVKVSAAWLIDRAGFTRGYGAGGVAISGKHALALTNRGTGTTAALLELARAIRNGVEDRFGVPLHPEPVLVNCQL